jgi:hypothetical protein
MMTLARTSQQQPMARKRNHAHGNDELGVAFLL